MSDLNSGIVEPENSSLSSFELYPHFCWVYSMRKKLGGDTGQLWNLYSIVPGEKMKLPIPESS